MTEINANRAFIDLNEYWKMNKKQLLYNTGSVHEDGYLYVGSCTLDDFRGNCYFTFKVIDSKGNHYYRNTIAVPVLANGGLNSLPIVYGEEAVGGYHTNVSASTSPPSDAVYVEIYHPNFNSDEKYTVTMYRVTPFWGK